MPHVVRVHVRSKSRLSTIIRQVASNDSITNQKRTNFCRIGVILVGKYCEKQIFFFNSPCRHAFVSLGIDGITLAPSRIFDTSKSFYQGGKQRQVFTGWAAPENNGSVD